MKETAKESVTVLIKSLFQNDVGDREVIVKIN